MFCTWMFHGVLEVQLRVGSTTGVSDVPPSERRCTSWLLQGWCQRRVAQYRAQAVRQGMQHAWAGYKAFAWGADEIHPKSKTAKTDIMVGAGRSGGIRSCGCCMVCTAHHACQRMDPRAGAQQALLPAHSAPPVAARFLRLQGGAGIKGMGVSMVDALSTLKVMGLHEQFQE